MLRSDGARAPQLLSLFSGACKSQLLSPRAAVTAVRASWSLCSTREAAAMSSCYLPFSAVASFQYHVFSSGI